MSISINYFHLFWCYFKPHKRKRGWIREKSKWIF